MQRLTKRESVPQTQERGANSLPTGLSDTNPWQQKGGPPVGGKENFESMRFRLIVERENEGMDAR